MFSHVFGIDSFYIFKINFLYNNPDNDSSSIVGIINDFTPHGIQPFLSFGIEPSSDCADCHGGITPMESDKIYMPYATWDGSMMANATRDPLLWAAVDIANNDIPGIGDFCIRCHTPTGFYSGHTKDGTGDMKSTVNAVNHEICLNA